MDINGIELTGESIVRAIKYNYPKGIIHPDVIEKNKIYNYVILFGIRFATCDSSMPDDFIGAIRLRKRFLIGGGDYWEILLSGASTDPSPYYLENAMIDAKYLGGTAWVHEGQYKYFLDSAGFKGEPAFRPFKPVKVYRWSPTDKEIKEARARKTPLSAEFEFAKMNGKVKISTSPDTLIHRSWGLNRYYKDSAGCQVFADNRTLRTLASWAKEHIKLYKENSFVYTLFNKDEFINANAESKKTSLIDSILGIKF